MAATPKSALRYQTIEGDKASKGTVQVSTLRTHRPRPASRPGPIQADVQTDEHEAIHTDDLLDEDLTVFHPLPERRKRSRPGNASAPPLHHDRRPVRTTEEHRPSRRQWCGAVALVILIPLLIFGVYSGAWYLHDQGVQGDISSHFGGHAPSDSLTLGRQVVFAHNEGTQITIYFIPSGSEQGTRLVEPLESTLGIPSKVIPTLSLVNGSLFLKLVGVPTYPQWTQPVALYKLQPTANGYQAVQVAA